MEQRHSIKHAGQEPHTQLSIQVRAKMLVAPDPNLSPELSLHLSLPTFWTARP
jgi:hypothetical protein